MTRKKNFGRRAAVAGIFVFTILVFQNCAPPQKNLMESKTSSNSSTSRSATSGSGVRVGGSSGSFSSSTPVVSQESSPAISSMPTPTPTPVPKVPVQEQPVNKLPPSHVVYRLLNPMAMDFLFSRLDNEGSPAYTLVGEAFELFDHADTDIIALIPLYRCRANILNTHFASTRQNCEGHINEGILGYLSEKSTGQTPQAIYRCYSTMIVRHLLTTNPNQECTPQFWGFKQEGVIGYAR